MKARRILFSVAAFAAMLLVWEFAVRSFDFAEYMLPPPSEVAMYLWGAVCDLSLPKAVWVTGKRLFTGYAISSFFFISVLDCPIAAMPSIAFICVLIS